FRSGDISGAKAILDKLYLENPKDIMTLKRQVFVSERSGDKQGVQKYSEELLSVEDSALNRLNQVQNFLKAGLVAEAQKKLESYKEKYPKELKSDALLLEAWVAKDQGKLEKALDLTNQSLGINPDNAIGLRVRGEIEISQGEYSQAIPDLQSSYSKSQDLDTRVKLAYAYYRANRNEDAISELVSIIKGSQENVGARTLLEGIYSKLGRVKELSRLYEETLQRYPNDVTWHNKAGAFALNSGQLENGEKLYKQSLEISQQKNGDSLDGYLNALNKSKKWAMVLEEGRKYTDGDLGFIAYLRMSEARIGLGDRPSAIELCKKAIEKAGSNENILELVLQRISGLLNKEEVRAFCDGILRASPNSIAANFTMYNLAKDNGEYNNSANYMDKCISSVEAGSPQWVNLTAKKAILMQLAYQKTTDNNYLEKAVFLYKSLLEKLPNNTGVLNNLAYLLVEDVKRIDEALGYAKRAYDQDRNNPNIMDTYGYVLFKKGELDKAVELIQAAAQQYERDNVSAEWDVYEHLGMVKEALKTEQSLIQAVAAYKKAIETGSGQMPDQAKKRIEEALKRLSR
ncbi:MAG: tetratricopeptide repeat protein, partial [Candidatus Atribacteria bacterium]